MKRKYENNHHFKQNLLTMDLSAWLPVSKASLDSNTTA